MTTKRRFTSGGMSPEWVDPAKVNGAKHIARYQYARKFLQPRDIVLDVACGCGYGSQIMSDSCLLVHGVDRNERALGVARRDYSVTGKTTYGYVNLDTVQRLPPCDVAVSFETIERLENPQRFAELLQECARRLIILSSPLQDVGSEWHKHPYFTKEQILDLFKNEKWKAVEAFRQKEGPYGIYRIERQSW